MSAPAEHPSPLDTAPQASEPTPGAAVGAPATEPPGALAREETAAPEVDVPAVASEATAEVPAEVPASSVLGLDSEGGDDRAAQAPVEVPGDASAAPAPSAAPDLSPAACAAALAERFPALFGAGAALPLKLRIQADIQARAPGVFTKKSLSIFLHRHTTSTAYLKALVNVPTRHDLDGQPAGEVAEEHRLAATAEVARRRAIFDARRQAEREAQRQAQRAAYAAQREAARAAQPATPMAPEPAGTPAAAGGEGGALPPPRRDRPPRPDRPPRGDRPPMGDRPARGAQPHAGDRTPRSDRPPRPDRPPRADRQPQPQAPVGKPDGPAVEGAATPQPPQPASPQFSAAELEVRRNRAALLRAYEQSTITRANFCVLKRISEAELEAQLVVARQERAQEPPPPPRRDDERDPWRNDRGPRPPQGRPPFKPTR